MTNPADLLSEYERDYPDEAERVGLFRRFFTVGTGLSEEMARGHVTGSAWIINRTRDRVLLTHHGKLGIWVQTGGHVEEGETVREGALREAREETGLTEFRYLKESLFDIDAHLIPARKDQPSHFHFDMRFLLEADSAEELIPTGESKDLKWVPLDDVPRYNRSESVLRMLRKCASYASSPVFGKVEEHVDYGEPVGEDHEVEWHRPDKAAELLKLDHQA